MATSDKKCRHCGSPNPSSARFCNACGKNLAPAVPFDGLIAEGTVLRGAYVVEDVIGEGGMGVVYRAHHQTLRSRYAIKVLDSKLARHATLRDRFLEEARIQATLSHPNIVRVHDVLDEGGIFGMVMEFIDGRTLDEYIHDEVGQVEVTEAIHLTVALLDAIGHAHRAGVIHRDLKPSNVLLVRGHDPDDIGPDLKVMDFGIAKILSEDGGRTVTGAKMGTPRYMAPEQVRNARDVDGRTDLYAIGLTLYEMVCGRHPYEELRDYDLLKAQVETMPPPPSRYRRDLPSDLERVILRALAKRPEERFADAEAFIDTLVELDTSRRTQIKRGRKTKGTPLQTTAAAAAAELSLAAVSDAELGAAYTAPSDIELETPGGTRRRSVEPSLAPEARKPAAAASAAVAPAPAGAAERGWSLGDTSVTGVGRNGAAVDESEPGSLYDDDEADDDDEDAGRRGRAAARPRRRGGAGRWLVRLLVLGGLVALGVYGYRAFFATEGSARGKPEPLSREQVEGGAQTDYTARPGEGSGPAGTRAPLVETVSSTTGMMSRLPAGEVMIGRAPGDAEAASDEAEGKMLALGALEIDQTEVSLWQYQRCVAEKVCAPLGEPERSSSLNEPVIGLGYASAETFCRWAGKRLPSEAEWEAAARAGTSSVYPFDGVPDCASANYGAGRGSECVGTNPGRVETVFSRELGKNRLHLRQMAGNVWEWTNTEGRSPQERIVKGGSFRSSRTELRVSARRSVKANAGDADVGFRCVRPAE